MNLRVVTTLALCAAAIVGCAAWLGAVNKDERRDAARRHPFALIDEKAQAAVRADEPAVRDLTDAVLREITRDFRFSYDRVPKSLLAPLKQRLVQAELAYRRGAREGIAEDKAVQVIANLAREFDAPSYAQTDAEEVRSIRQYLAHYAPCFIPQTNSIPVADEEPRLRDTMSPLEATLTVSTLINLKLHNETMLLTPEERADIKVQLARLDCNEAKLTREERGMVMMALVEQKLHPVDPARTIEELAARSKQVTAKNAREPKAVLSLRTRSEREQEMDKSVRRVAKLDKRKQLELVNEALGTLGM